MSRVPASTPLRTCSSALLGDSDYSAGTGEVPSLVSGPERARAEAGPGPTAALAATAFAGRRLGLLCQKVTRLSPRPRSERAQQPMQLATDYKSLAPAHSAISGAG